jgi:hypothetical protein
LAAVGQDDRRRGLAVDVRSSPRLTDRAARLVTLLRQRQSLTVSDNLRAKTSPTIAAQQLVLDRSVKPPAGFSGASHRRAPARWDVAVSWESDFDLMSHIGQKASSSAVDVPDRTSLGDSEC